MLYGITTISEPKDSVVTLLVGGYSGLKQLNGKVKGWKKLTEMDEAEFRKRYPNNVLLVAHEGATTRAYATNGYLWMFDKCDGHLAWKYNQATKTVEYECNCIKRGRLLVRD